MALSGWSPTAASNSTVGGVNIAENCPAAGINNAIRALMADVATGVNVSLLGTFLSSSTLANARTALGVTEGSASQTAFGALTNTANSFPYMTGSDAWALTTLTTFGRSLIDDGDAATARTTLAALGLTSSSFGTNTLDVRITLGNGTTLCVVGGTGTLGANTTGTLNFGVTFATAPVVMVSGGDALVGSEGQVRSSAAASTSSIAIINAGPASGTYNWIAWGSI